MNAWKRIAPIVVASIAMPWLVACESESGSPGKQASASQEPASPPAEGDASSASAQLRTVVLEGDDVVLATVNGEPITRYDLQTTAVRMLGEGQAALLSADVQRKVLDSLVTSRVLAQRQLERMSPEARAALDKDVATYREQLLVKAHLDESASPAPVTEAMIREYYERHPQQFGARSIRRFEMLFAAEPLGGSASDRLSAALLRVRDRSDWQLAAQALIDEGHRVRYRTGRAHAKLLEPALSERLDSLAVNESSDVVIVEQRPYLLRVVAEQQVPPQPLDEVRSEIRKMLVPIQLTKAIKASANDALAQAQVVYSPPARN